MLELEKEEPTAGDVVADPPGAPYIEGFDSNVVQRGRQLELICKSRGGNPLAQLIWYKNNDPVHMKYFTHDSISESTYTFTADASDNNAVYRCTATNIMSQTPLSAQVTVTVECEYLSSPLPSLTVSSFASASSSR